MTSKETIARLEEDNYFKNYTNDELIDEIERGLRKGYWDKRLLPEVRRRFGTEAKENE